VYNFTYHKRNLKPFLADYIYRTISSKKQKGQTQRNRFALLKNDITNIFDPWYLHFHSRYQKFL